MRPAFIFLVLLAVVGFGPSAGRTAESPPLDADSPSVVEAAVAEADSGSAVRTGSGPVHVVTVHGVIHPASSRIIEQGIERATRAGAQALVIELDTPGGLLNSVHEISKDILGSEVPVIVHVAPEGSRATSAGVLVTISAHLAVMAPGTHIGAAHVVTMQGSIQDSVVNEKAMNDWVAELRSVARIRDRNEEWVERAARESASLIADEAVEEGVVDLVAGSLDELLVAVDGREVTVFGETIVLATARAEVVRIEPDFQDQFLSLISDPSIAYLLFLIGIYGLIFELSNPGAILPGVAGAICIIVGLYALHTLPINWAGVLLILLAIVLFIVETQVPSFGVLTLGGVVAMVVGSIMLFDEAGPLFELSLWVILPAAGATALFFGFVMAKALGAQRARTTTGSEGLVGETGEARTDLDPDGTVFLHGEIWSATAAGAIAKGDRVRVVRVDGLRVTVELDA